MSLRRDMVYFFIVIDLLSQSYPLCTLHLLLQMPYLGCLLLYLFLSLLHITQQFPKHYILYISLLFYILFINILLLLLFIWYYPSCRSNETCSMTLIKKNHSIILLCKIYNFIQWCYISIHTKYPISDNQPMPLLLTLF